MPNTIPKEDHDRPQYCFQCQQWHSSKKDQEQAHATLHIQRDSTPAPEAVQLGGKASGSMDENAFAARMSQAIKEAVAAEFDSRNMPPRGSYEQYLDDHGHQSPTHHRPRQMGSRNPDPDIKDDIDYISRHPRRHIGVSSMGRKYTQASVQESRSTTPSDARAWYDAFTDLDPDEVRAESESDLTAVFSDMTILDYKHGNRKKLRKAYNREYKADDCSSEGNNSEEDTGLPLKYLPSRYPNPLSGNRKISLLDRSQGQAKYEKSSTRKTKSEDTANREAETTRRQHQNISGRPQRDTLEQGNENEKEIKREVEKTPKKQKQQDFNKGGTKARVKADEPSPSPTPTKTTSPTTADAHAAVLAYAQWYAETHGIGQSFVRNLEASMSVTNQASSPGYYHHNTKKYRPTKAMEHLLSSNPPETCPSSPSAGNAMCVDQSNDDSTSPSDCSLDESSTKSDRTVRANRQKGRTTRSPDQRGSIRGGSMAPSSSGHERITKFLLQRGLQSLQSTTPPRNKTTNPESSQTHENTIDEKRGTQQQTPPVAILRPIQTDTEPSPLVLERTRRWYSLILDQNSQSLKSVPADVATTSGNGRLNKSPTTILPSQRLRPYFQPKVETVIDEYHPGCQSDWTWDREFGAYVNTGTNQLRPSTDTPGGVSEQGPRCEKLGSNLSTTQFKDTVDAPARSEDGEVSVFDYQVDELPEIQGLPQSTNELGDSQRIDMQEGDDDGWEDEGNARDSDSDDGYLSELLSELVSGKYSDVVSGIYSDADTEITVPPGVDSTGKPRVNGYISDETMDIILSAIERGKKQKREKREREGGERQSGCGRLYSRGNGDFMGLATRQQ